MAYAKILRSPLPHARILKVDAGKARALPGVIDVLTRDELAGLNYKYGATYKDQAVVAVDKVRYVGDPVAAVLSADELVAEEALGLIDVEYEELPFVDTVDDALAPGAPQVHEGDVPKAELRGSKYGAPDRFKGTNVCYHFGYARGNVEDGFASSDHVYEDVFRFNRVQHYSLEPHICLAHYDGERLTVWSSCQDPFTLRGHLGGIFKLPLNRVRVVVPYVGGGYGGKLYVKADPIAAALSVRNRRPVKLAMSVTESFKTVTRHPARIRIKTGVSKKGELVARELEVYMDTGAYADAGPRVTQKAGYRAVGPYRVANVKIDAHGVYSNTVPAGAFRGFGAVQVAWAYESQMDMIAKRLGMDPLDFRLKNLLEKGEPYTPGDTPVDCDLKQGLRRVARALDWKKASRPNVGKGLSVCLKDAGGTYKVAGATVKMSSDGSAVLLTGTVEVGQGSRTALSQVVAEELGIKLEEGVRGPVGYRRHPLRRVHQRQQFHDGHGPGDPEGGPGREEAVAAGRGQGHGREGRQPRAQGRPGTRRQGTRGALRRRHRGVLRQLRHRDRRPGRLPRQEEQDRGAGFPHHLLGGGLGRRGAGGGPGHRCHPHPQVCLPGRRGTGHQPIAGRGAG